MSGQFSPYYLADQIEAGVEAGRHRTIVGGLWDEIGRLQLDTLIEHGLKPEHRLIDIGCGSLRGGVHFIRYLESGHYYGVDINPSLLAAGYDVELANAGLQSRLPREQLVATSSFDMSSFDVTFDRAIALSLFTHLPLDVIRVCLERLAPKMAPNGVFYATFFETPEGQATMDDIRQEPAGIVTHAGADPFHQRFSDFLYLCAGLPWQARLIGDFGHPRGQKLIEFVRSEEPFQAIASTRSLSVSEASGLGAGDDHYRAYVGPPGRYDFIGASQFALLFQFGLRDTHKVLDFGCGSLRLGRMLIPFLAEGGYFGIDPNRWLIEDGIDRELGRSALALKKPRFSYNSDFDCDVFGEKFNFIIAQSIITHTGPDLIRPLLDSVAKSIVDDGVFLFSYIREGEAADLPPDGWHYPGCVGYGETDINALLAEVGLEGRGLRWFHPGATWYMAMKAGAPHPSDEELALLTGNVVARS